MPAKCFIHRHNVELFPSRVLEFIWVKGYSDFSRLSLLHGRGGAVVLEVRCLRRGIRHGRESDPHLYRGAVRDVTNKLLTFRSGVCKSDGHSRARSAPTARIFILATGRYFAARSPSGPSVPPLLLLHIYLARLAGSVNTVNRTALGDPCQKVSGTRTPADCSPSNPLLAHEIQSASYPTYEAVERQLLAIP